MKAIKALVFSLLAIAVAVFITIGAIALSTEDNIANIANTMAHSAAEQVGFDLSGDLIN